MNDREEEIDRTEKISYTKGPFKCYVTHMGVGVSGFLEKSVTKV